MNARDLERIKMLGLKDQECLLDSHESPIGPQQGPFTRKLQKGDLAGPGVSGDLQYCVIRLLDEGWRKKVSESGGLALGFRASKSGGPVRGQRVPFVWLRFGGSCFRLELTIPIKTSSEFQSKPPRSFFLQINLVSILLGVPIKWIIPLWEHIREHVLGGAVK